MSKSFEVYAECHSDDHVVECEFDATQWLKKATLKDIVALAKCNWGGDYGSDQVAIDMAKKDKDIEFMFKYVELRKSKRYDVGFECYVNEVEARTWLQNNRPKIYAKLLKGVTDE